MSLASSGRRLLLAFLLAGCVPALAAESYVVPPGQRVAGRSQADWSSAWWQWAGSFESYDSPVGDRTGVLCALKQSGDVWFLAGTYGTRRTERTCRVPRGKYLFFPLVNMVMMPTREGSATCKGLKASAARAADTGEYLVLDVDGVQAPNLKGHRQAPAKCFDMGQRAEPPVRIYPSASDGYWVMLKPLPPGTHEINFGGVMGGMLQAVTYKLVIE